MGIVCFGACCGPCPTCNPEGEPRTPGCGHTEGFSGPYIKGMFTGDIPPSVVFENGGVEEEED